MDRKKAGHAEWSERQIVEFRKLWSQTEPRLSSAEIGARMGMTKTAILGKAHRLGLPSRNSPILQAGSGERPRSVPRPKRDKINTLPPIIAEPAGPAPFAARSVPPARGASIVLLRSRVFSQPRACQWPLNDGKPWRFCEAAIEDLGVSYCREHGARAFDHKRHG